MGVGVVKGIDRYIHYYNHERIKLELKARARFSTGPNDDEEGSEPAYAAWQMVMAGGEEPNNAYAYRESPVCGTRVGYAQGAGWPTMQATKIYDAFGHCRQAVGVPRSGLSGQVMEDSLPWYVLGKRIYVASLRRFISPGPVSPFGSGGANRYTYCNSDPINRIDPTGNAWWDWLGAALGMTQGKDLHDVRDTRKS